MSPCARSPKPQGSAFMARIDAEVLAGTPTRSDPEETVRDRLFDAMMRRYDALRPYREALGAIRRAGTRDPMLALAMGLLGGLFPALRAVRMSTATALRAQ